MRKNDFLVIFLLAIFLLLILCAESTNAYCDCYDLGERFNPSNLIIRIKEILESNKGITSTGLTEFDINLLQKQSEIEQWTYTVSNNSATKYSLDDLCGLIEPENWWIGARFDPCLPTRDLPESFDWRDVNGTDYTTPIKNQGSCGSCWAFGTVGPLECNIKINDGLEVNLSEQWLVNCNLDGWGCDGGWWAHDYHQWKNDSCGDTGAVLEEHCPYTASDDTCACPYPHDYFINNWSYIGTGSGVPPVDSIKQAIYTYGPVSAALCVNNAFQSYSGGIFNGPSCTLINHAVTLVGWNDSQGSDGVWILRNSWGTDWGEDGYMRIEYGVSQIGYGACYVNYTVTPKINIKIPDGIPESVPQGNSINLTLQIEQINDMYVNGTGKIYYRYDNGSYYNSTLEPISENLYEAILPPSVCGDILEYYFTAEGNLSGLTYNPPNAPNKTHCSLVGELTTVFSDEFDSDLGWAVQNDSNLTDGAWERGTPVGDGDRGDPPTDYNGSGSCYLTDNEAGNSDVDGGITWLISPTFNLSAGIDAKIDYALWYTNNFGADPNNDLFKTYISNDDGENWILVETIGIDTPAIKDWHEYSFILSRFVLPTNKIKVRFEASDLNDGSVVEAGIDNFCIKILHCSNTIQICELFSSWNFVSIPFNNSINKTDVIVSVNQSIYSWQEAVDNNIVLDYIYQWNRSIQNYEFTVTLSTGNGYWVYAYTNCTLWFQNNLNFVENNYITDAIAGWNIIGIPQNITIGKYNITVYYNQTSYTWQEAVNESIILGLIYRWDEINQKYEQSAFLNPGKAYWMYAYKNCKLLKSDN